MILKSTNEKPTKMDIQAERQRIFPEDRIPFLKNNQDAANKDKTALHDWFEHGQWRKGASYRSAAHRAMDAIARNNYLDEITEVQFDKLLQITGYGRLDWEKMKAKGEKDE